MSNRLIEVLRTERNILKRQLDALEAAITTIAGDVVKAANVAGKKTQKMSEATKEKLRKAAKARWAKIKKS